MKPVIGLHRLFFAAAAIQAMLSIGLWIFAPASSADATTWHAHEMVFGYAVAVIAGFLFTKTTLLEALPVFTLWVAARLSWLFLFDAPVIGAILSIGATASIAWISARGFLRGVKRAQNIVFPALLGLLVGCEILSQLQAFGVATAIARPAILFAIYVIAALIVVMGGRIAGAAFSGLLQRASGPRIAPRLGLERSIPVLMGGAAVAMSFELHPVILTICALCAALVILVRLRDWSPALRLAGADLLALAASQAFMAAGLLGIGLQFLNPPWSAAAPLHLLTIGGIGVATATMMLKTVAQRDRRPLLTISIATAATLLGLAAILRAAGEALGAFAYMAAALAWCAAMLCCALGVLRR